MELKSTANTHAKEWERVREKATQTGRVEMMDIRRSGSVPSISDDRCCSYDCVWKMLKSDTSFQNQRVAAIMWMNRQRNPTQFQDLNITHMKNSSNHLTLRNIVSMHGYELHTLKDIKGKKIEKKSDLMFEVFCSTRKGMYICNLISENEGVCHTVSITKEEDGSSFVYDANMPTRIQLSVESLSECLGGLQCGGMDKVVQLVKQRTKKKKIIK